MENESKSTTSWRTKLVVVLAILCAFFLGRSWGFNEAKKAYEPVLEKSQSVIDDLQKEIENLYAYFEGATPSTKTEGTKA